MQPIHISHGNPRTSDFSAASLIMLRCRDSSPHTSCNVRGTYTLRSTVFLSCFPRFLSRPAIVWPCTNRCMLTCHENDTEIINCEVHAQCTIWVIHAHAIGVPIPFFVVHLVLNSFGWHPSGWALIGLWCEPPWAPACAVMAPPGRFSVTVLSPIVYAGLVVRRFSSVSSLGSWPYSYRLASFGMPLCENNNAARKHALEN